MSGVLKCLDMEHSNQVAVRADLITEALMTTESDHSANHFGYGFKGHINVEDLAAGASLSWCLTTGSVGFNHIKNLTLSVLGSSAKVEILRGAAVTVNTGSEVALPNTNDNSDRVAGSTIKADPTYTGGTVWDQMEAYADSTNQSVGTSSINASAYEELVSKNLLTPYIIKITNTGSSTLLKAWLKLFFYEEPKGLV